MSQEKLDTYKEIVAQFATVGGILAGFAFSSLNKAIDDAVDSRRTIRWSAILNFYATGGLLVGTLVSGFLYVVISAGKVNAESMTGSITATSILMGFGFFSLIASSVLLALSKNWKVAAAVCLVFSVLLANLVYVVVQFWNKF